MISWHTWINNYFNLLKWNAAFSSNRKFSIQRQIVWGNVYLHHTVPPCVQSEIHNNFPKRYYNSPSVGLQIQLLCIIKLAFGELRAKQGPWIIHEGIGWEGEKMRRLLVACLSSPYFPIFFISISSFSTVLLVVLFPSELHLRNNVCLGMNLNVE